MKSTIIGASRNGNEFGLLLPPNRIGMKIFNPFPGLTRAEVALIFLGYF